MLHTILILILLALIGVVVVVYLLFREVRKLRLDVCTIWDDGFKKQLRMLWENEQKAQGKKWVEVAEGGLTKIKKLSRDY